MEKHIDILPLGASSRYHFPKCTIAFIDEGGGVKILAEFEGYLTIPIQKLSEQDISNAKKDLAILLPNATEEWIVDAGNDVGVGLFRMT